MNLHPALTDRHPPRRGMLLFAALMAGAAAQAQPPDPAAAAAASGQFCTATAKLLRAACGFEAGDDLFVAQAKCINVGAAAPRLRCLREAQEARAEATEECTAQLQARQDACVVLGEGRYDPPFTPDRFDTDFSNLSRPNPYFPLAIGNRWEYRGDDQRTTVEVHDATKSIEGVTCVVLRDLVYEEDLLIEATDDWFAAGLDGSAWYCGEEAKDFETFEGDDPQAPELVSIDGSFKHGRERDKAGLIMPALPVVGQAYREEFSLGNAEDVAEVVSVNYSYGSNPELDDLVPPALAQLLCSADCVVTKAYALLEPGVFELKYYARGIGLFLETNPGEGSSLQLVGCSFDPRCASLPQP